MADQRPSFRFRLPWQSAAPPPRPSFPRRPSSQPTATPTPTTTAQTAATPAPNQPTTTTTPTIAATPQTATTPAPTQPTITTTPTTATALQTAATQAPPQPTITTTPTTPTAPQTAATEAPPQPTITTTPTTPTAPQTAATEAPPQPTLTTTPTPTTSQTAETQVPMQPSSLATPAPTPQTAERVATTQPTITTSISPTPVPQRAETQIPTQPPAATTTPIPTTERPPFRPPGVAPAQAPLLQSQTSRTKSQPSSPSRVTTPPVPTQPASPSRAATQSQASSQPLTPPRALPQSQAVSLPSSPSRTSPQLASTPRKATQPRSTTILASHPADQALSSPPSSTTAQPQPTTEAVNQPTSPSKREQNLTRNSSQPSANSTEVRSPLTDKQEPKSVVSETPSLELRPKPATISGAVNDSQDRAPKETSIQPNQIIREPPSKESGMEAAKMLSTAEGVSHNSINNEKAELFPTEFKPEETKEVKEVVQENKGKAHNGARHKEADLTGELGQTMQAKDLPSIAFQSEQTQKHFDRKEVTAASASNGKQSKITMPQSRNKTMVVDTHQKLATSNGEHIPLHKEVRDDISKLVNKMAIGDSKHSIDDRPVSVITLAGENRGASMQVGFESSKKEGAVHIRRGYKSKPDDSAEATTDGEESFKEKSNNPENKKDQASEEYVNSNVQVINNSIMFNSSITEKNPGVHLIHSHFPTEPKKPSEKPGLAEIKKAEYNITPSQKLTYEPTVRRRCLRGLLLESSDSDMDGSKSQRHGCRVGCNEKSKENNIDLL